MLFLLSLLHPYASVLHRVLPRSPCVSLQLSIDNDKRAVPSPFEEEKKAPRAIQIDEGEGFECGLQTEGTCSTADQDVVSMPSSP